MLGQSATTLDLGDVRYVKRIRVGGGDADGAPSDGQTADAMALLNRCLTTVVRGAIMAVEKSTRIITVGEQPAVFEAITCHVGFPHKPAWLNE